MTLIYYERISGQGFQHFIHVHESLTTTKSDYIAIAKLVCGDQRVCFSHFWNDKNNVPLSLPFSDEQINSRIASYNKNKNTGFERVLICAEDGC